MKLVDTPFADLKLIEPRLFQDDRGFFLEAWNARSFADIGLDQRFVQDNHSRSAKGVLRGLHYQLARPQGKLVRVVTGRVFDVVVDIRRSSPDFGKWFGVELSEKNKLILWVPPGFAHGFLSLEEGSDFLYKCTGHHVAEDERTILWSDPEIGIEWPTQGLSGPSVSANDAAGRPLREAEVYR